MRAELICSVCGLVAADALVLPGTESPFGEDEKYLGLEADDSAIRPQLLFSSRDVFGKPVGNQKVWLLRRTAQTYNPAPGERSLWQMEARIKRLASQLHLPRSVAVRAIYLYRQIRRKSMFKKPGLDALARALILAACRSTKYIITLERVSLTGWSPHDQTPRRGKSASFQDLSDRLRFMGRVDDYKNDILRALGLPNNRPTVENYVTCFAGQLGVNGPVITAASRLALQHPNPNYPRQSAAAGALFIILRGMGYVISQKDFGKAVVISEVSLRKCVNLLGGYQENNLAVLDVQNTDLVDVELGGPIGDDEDGDGEEGPEDGGQYPSSPEQPKGDDDDTRDAQKRKRRRPRRKRL